MEMFKPHLDWNVLLVRKLCSLSVLLAVLAMQFDLMYIYFVNYHFIYICDGTVSPHCDLRGWFIGYCRNTLTEMFTYEE